MFRPTGPGNDEAVTVGRLSLRALLQRPVTVRGIRVGTPEDAVLDGRLSRVLGLEIVCADGVTRFLPLAAARMRDDRVTVESPLVLLEEDQRAFYRRGSRPLRELLGAPLLRDGRPLGELVDLLVAEDGSVVAVSAACEGSAPALHDRAGLAVGRAAEVPAA